MRSAYLDDARPEDISHAVRDVLERRGALISEHRHSRVRFHGLKPHDMSWTRAGYVGIYQPVGESAAEVRLRLRARVPWRLLWAACIVNVFLLLLAILTNPPGTTWSLYAIFGGSLLTITGVLYIQTLKRVRDEEASMMGDFENALNALDANLETADDRELRELEAELEGEITRRKIEANRPPAAKGNRFSLLPGKKKSADAGDEDPEARRARLLARKAELEAKKRESEGGE